MQHVAKIVTVVSRTVSFFCRDRKSLILSFCVVQQYLVKFSVVFPVRSSSASDTASSNKTKIHYIILNFLCNMVNRHLNPSIKRRR